MPKQENTTLAVTEPKAITQYNAEQIDVLRSQLCYPEASDLDVGYFLGASKSIGLDPYAIPKEVTCMPRSGKMVLLVTVNGYVKLATQCGDIEYISDPEFLVCKGAAPNQEWEWTPLWFPGSMLTHARITIKRKSLSMPQTFTISKAAFENPSNGKWKSAPDQMMASTVLGHALRRSGAIYAMPEVPRPLQALITSGEPDFDHETGEMLMTPATRRQLHSGHSHAEVHQAVIEATGKESLRDCTEDDAQEVLTRLATAETPTESTIVEMAPSTRRDRSNEEI